MINLEFKKNNIIQLNGLKKFLSLFLIVILSACSNIDEKEINIITEKRKLMLNELYETKTTPGRAIMTDKIILKYFKIDTDKQKVLSKLKKMEFEYTEDDKENLIYLVHSNKSALIPGAKTLEIEFYFNDNNKLIRVFSRIYNTI